MVSDDFEALLRAQAGVNGVQPWPWPHAVLFEQVCLPYPVPLQLIEHSVIPSELIARLFWSSPAGQDAAARCGYAWDRWGLAMLLRDGEHTVYGILHRLHGICLQRLAAGTASHPEVVALAECTAIIDWWDTAA